VRCGSHSRHPCPTAAEAGTGTKAAEAGSGGIAIITKPTAGNVIVLLCALGLLLGYVMYTPKHEQNDGRESNQPARCGTPSCHYSSSPRVFRIEGRVKMSTVSENTFTTNRATIDAQSEDHSHRAHSADLIPILISLYSAHGSEIWGWLLVLRSQWAMREQLARCWMELEFC
jgi:hypothetical protein